MRLARLLSKYATVNHVFMLWDIFPLRRCEFEIHVFSGHSSLQGCESKRYPGKAPFR